MSGVQMQFDLNDLYVISAFDQVAAAGENLFPLMDAIGRVLVNGARERIAVTNIDPDGVTWPVSLRAKEQGGPTLHDSGRLMNSITSEAEARQVVVGSNLIYAAVHQGGATIRPKTAGALSFTLANGEKVVVDQVTIPRRAYIGASRAEVEDIADLAQSYFAELLDGRAV